jgi:hypothetical protein
MVKNELLKLENLPYFTTTQLNSITPEGKNTLKKSINRFLAKKILIQIKKGTYVTTKYIDNLRDEEKMSYYEFLASILKTPSYLSSEYVLTKYDILTESSYIHTSITTKNTKTYNNSLGIFKYQNIREELFEGYETKYFRNKPYYIATVSKALFDFIYFRADLINMDLNINLTEELRLKTDILSKKNWSELEKYAKKSGNNKIIKIVENLQKNASNNN